MKVLVACEYSGIVRNAFAAKGHDAWSCDILPTESPGNHYQGDVLEHLDKGWDLMIAHPPCTYLSNAGARFLYPKGKLNKGRYKLGLKAKEFFMALYNAPIDKICVENPISSKIYQMPKHTQTIQPYEYGHPYSKNTRLWLKNLPKLIPTNNLKKFKPYLPSNTGGKKKGQKFSNGVVHNWKDASKTFDGIAAAMANQWNIESTKKAGNWFNKGGKDRQKNRSKLFDGIADAMADQWGNDG
jgi:hypothetical protein